MKIACILAEGFEDSEFRVPVDRLEAEGYDVQVIGKKAGETLTGKASREKITTDAGIGDVAVDDFDLLLIPGGHSPDALRADARFVDFVRAFDRARKPIAAVCHGPQLFIAAGIQRDRKLTAWPTVQVDLRAAGAEVVDAEVVEDGNWITSRKPEDLPAFSDAVLRALDADDHMLHSPSEASGARPLA